MEIFKIPFVFADADLATHKVIRNAEQGYAYTSIQVDTETCRICGGQWSQVHTLAVTDTTGATRAIGSVRACEDCQRQSWLFTSHMPRAVAGRAMDARAVV